MATPLSFIWKGKDSLQDYGLYIKSFPDRIRPAERIKTVEIPGRSGSMILLEGEEVYSPYNTEMTVLCKKYEQIDRAVEWLRGSSDLVLSNDHDKARHAMIANEVRFSADGRNSYIGNIPFLFQPFRVSRFPEQTDRISVSTASATISNPGDVASRPKVSFSGTNGNTITIGGKTMSFTGVAGTIIVDCDAEMIFETLPPAVTLRPYSGTSTGEFWKIPVGQSTVTQTGNKVITIDPNWRWL